MSLKVHIRITTSHHDPNIRVHADLELRDPHFQTQDVPFKSHQFMYILYHFIFYCMFFIYLTAVHINLYHLIRITYS